MPDAPGDALPPSIDYTLYVGKDQPRSSDPPTVFIDGLPSQSVHRVYANRAAAGDFPHRVELRYQDQVLVRIDMTSKPEDCGPGPASTGAVLRIEESLDELDSGDLRFGSEEVMFEHAACVGDGFAIPRCGCPTDQRCIPRILRESPLFTQMGCAPTGTKQDGEACTLVADPAGAYDDCGAGLFCYQSTCHALCTGGQAPTGTLPDGYPPEAQLCD
jgi:hypothetical protein